jgi:IS30 family transposase
MSHETIYRHVYADKAIGGDPYKSLRCQRKRLKRYAGGRDRRGQILDRRPICQRSRHIEERRQIGRREGDTLIGKSHKHAIVSLVERKSGYAVLAKVENKTTDLGATAIIKRLMPISERVQTLTYDNVKGFAIHASIDKALGSTTYFADPYSSWQRGSNENLHGLIRQYIPKSRTLSTVTDDELAKIEMLLNTRPRKRLGYKTPIEIFTSQLDCVALRA